MGNFNPHPRTEDDLFRRCFWLGFRNFNPHPRTEDDTMPSSYITLSALFQSTSSHGGWQAVAIGVAHFLEFQSTSSHGGWRHRLQRLWFVIRHFNPHPRTEDDEAMYHLRGWHVSFQSTSSHGGWRHCRHHLHGDWADFNPHPRTEDDWWIR